MMISELAMAYYAGSNIKSAAVDKAVGMVD